MPYIVCMHKTTVYLQEALYEQIRALAQATGRSQATLIREALAAYAMTQRPTPTSVGLGSSGLPNLSERVDQELEGMGED